MLTGNKNQQRYNTSRKYESLRIAAAKNSSIIMKELQGGNKNSQYNTIWVHNKTSKVCKKVPKDSILEVGWERGRILDWYKEDKISKNRLIAEEYRNKKKLEIKEYYTKLYETYKVYGFDEIVKIGYQNTKQNLVSQFAKYVDGFVPQNGKRRKQQIPR